MLEPMLSEAVHDGILDGRLVAARLRQQVRLRVGELGVEGHTLTLALVRVGDDPASAVYVTHKVRACAEVGIASAVTHLPETTDESTLLETIERLNLDERIDGVLVQLPLPAHMDVDRVIEAVAPSKDVDGFHPANLGRLMAGYSLLEPCTPSGVMMLLAAAGVSLRGKRAVVVGRSVIVGRPMAQMLLRANATVTVCHRYTTDLAEHVAAADVVVVAAGVPGLVEGAWIKPGAVVIDVGINRLDDNRLVGDVEFAPAKARASAITPVPGGVGPMTIAMLMWNTLLAGAARRGVFGPDIQAALERSKDIG